MAHPSGVAAGVASVRQAWDAALSGVPLGDYAATHTELREAIEKYSKPK